MANKHNRPNQTTLYVRGWTNSKASNNQDGGVSDLKAFLEKKASRSIFRTNVNGDALAITVNAQDISRFTHINGFTWAGTTLSVQDSSSNSQPPTGPRSQQNNNRNGQNQRDQQQNTNNNHNNNKFSNNQPQFGTNNIFHVHNAQRNQNNNQSRKGGHQRGPDSMSIDDGATQDQLVGTMISVIHKRYAPATKFLQLEALAREPEFQAIGLSSQPAAKVFAALFVCCEKQVFETPLKRKQMVESLSLRGNGLTTVKDCIAAASTFTNLKNLDLGDNLISDVGELRYWKSRLGNMEHLILTGNPVDSNPDTLKTLRKWFRNLKIYNNQPLPAADDVLQPFNPPQPTGSPVYQLPTEPHPEFPPGSTFGVALPGKPDEQLLKEQMGLKFSYETRLKMQWVEQCLGANNFIYDAAMADLQNNMNAGNIPADAFLQV